MRPAARGRAALGGRTGRPASRLAGGGSVRAARNHGGQRPAAPPRSRACRTGLRLPLRPVYGDILRLRVPAAPAAAADGHRAGHGPRGTGVHRPPAGRHGGDRRHPARGRTVRHPGDAPCPPAASTSCCATPSSWCPPSPNWSCWKPPPGPGPARRTTPRCWARVARPADGGDVPGLIIATGFFRHGVLLTPAAAAICRELMDGARRTRAGPAFRPERCFPASPGHVRGQPTQRKQHEHHTQRNGAARRRRRLRHHTGQPGHRPEHSAPTARPPTGGNSASPWPATPKWCRAASGTPRRSPTATTSNSSRQSREDDRHDEHDSWHGTQAAASTARRQTRSSSTA